MGIKSFGNNAEDFINKFLRARSFDSTGLDAAGKIVPIEGITASGGIVADYTDGPAVYRTHIFTSSGTFEVTSLATGNFPNSIEYLVIAGGGGGGGGYYGGGGGAGGLRTNLSGHPLATGNPSFTVTAGPTSYIVTVGAGGAYGNYSPPGTPAGFDGSSGQNSYFGPPSSPQGITATGGGGGRGRNAGGAAGIPGGSGGGTAYGPPGAGGFGRNPATPGPETGPYAWTEGNPGGDNPSASFYGSGGGGAGGAAPPGPSSGGPYGYPGGVGIQVLIAGPTNAGIGSTGPLANYGYFAGGGGGGGPDATNLGGYGGGGNGAIPTSPAQNGTYATGGGGGGGMYVAPPFVHAGSGGSGIVAIRYQIASITATARATGGAISYYGGKTIHTFTGSGTFATEPNWVATNVEYVVVGGGGAGSGSPAATASGGGGAGGYITGTTPIGAHPVSTTVQVGAGGISRVRYPDSTAGTPSYFGTPLTAYGGGRGSQYPAFHGEYGGSGGGGGYGEVAGFGLNPSSPAPLIAAFPNYTPGTTQGYPGGNGVTNPSQAGGGGGGAGGAGVNATGPGDSGSHGGIGVQLPATFRDPKSSVGAPGPGGGKYWVAGGGGGGYYQTYIPSYSKGGSGPAGGGPYAGGGNGGQDPIYLATSGLENTGGGGGGSGYGGEEKGAGSGGSGIVMIAYPS